MYFYFFQHNNQMKRIFFVHLSLYLFCLLIPKWQETMVKWVKLLWNGFIKNRFMRIQWWLFCQKRLHQHVSDTHNWDGPFRIQRQDQQSFPMQHCVELSFERLPRPVPILNWKGSCQVHCNCTMKNEQLENAIGANLFLSS